MADKNVYSRDLDFRSPTKNTEILYNEIKEATNIYTFLQNNTDILGAKSFGNYLSELLESKEIRKTQLLYVTGLSRSFIYALLKDDRVPSRDTVINLGFSIGVTLEEMYNLLRYSGHTPLYAKNHRDAIMIFGLKQNMPLTKVNDILFDLNIPVIGW